MLTDTSSSLLRSGSSSLKTETKKNNNKMHFLVPLCHFVQQNECHKMKREPGRHTSKTNDLRSRLNSKGMFQNLLYFN